MAEAAEQIVYSDEVGDFAESRLDIFPEESSLDRIIDNEFSKADSFIGTGSFQKAIGSYKKMLSNSWESGKIGINRPIVMTKMAHLYLKQLDFGNALSCFSELADKRIDNGLVGRLMDKAAEGMASPKEQFEINDFYLKMNALAYSGMIFTELGRIDEADAAFSEVFSSKELMEKMDIAARTQLNTLEFEERYFNLAIAYFYKGLSLKMQGKDPSEFYGKSVEYMESRGRDPFLMALFAIAENESESGEKKKVYLEFAEKLTSKFDFDLSISQFSGSRNVVIEVKDDYGFLNSSLVIKIGLDKSALMKEFNILKMMNAKFPESTTEPLVIYRSKASLFTGERFVRKSAYFMLLRRAPGKNAFDALKKRAYDPGNSVIEGIIEGQGISKSGLASRIVDALRDFHEFGGTMRLKGPGRKHYSGKIRDTFLKYFSICGKEARDFMDAYGCVGKELGKAPLDFYTDANLRNWSIGRSESSELSITKYDFESMKALPCMLELVSIVEFPRMYLSENEKQDAIDRYYFARMNLDSSFGISKPEFDHLFKVASLHRHLEFAGYRMRDSKEISIDDDRNAKAISNLCYSCYHLQSAIERAEELGFRELGSCLRKIKGERYDS